LIVTLGLDALDFLTPCFLLLDTHERVLQLLSSGCDLFTNEFGNTPLLHREVQPRQDQEIKVGRLEVVLTIQIEKRAHDIVVI